MGHKGIPIGGKVIPKKAPPSSSKEFVYQAMPDTVNPEARNPAQIEAELALGATAKYAAQSGNASGKVHVGGRVVNRLTIALAKVLAGKDYGGMTYEERLAAHRAATDASLLRLANVLGAKSNGRKFSSVADVVSQFAAKEVSSALAQLSGQ